jgi:hypothetical protein
MGASPSWNVFCIDFGIAFTPDLGVIGDLRLRIDPARFGRAGRGPVGASSGPHVHTSFAGPVSRAEFEQCLNEGSPDPIPPFMIQFVRWCAPLLDPARARRPLFPSSQDGLGRQAGVLTTAPGGAGWSPPSPAKASSTMPRPSSSRWWGMTNGGKKRSTLP